MDFALKKPVLVYSQDEGADIERSDVVVEFNGKRGLKAIKGLQDVIFKTFRDSASEGGSKNVDDGKTSKDETSVDEILGMLEMTGNSEAVFDVVMKSVAEFGRIGGVVLSNAIQEEMHTDDLQGLYEEVLRNFLLPKIILKMNSMKS